MKQCSKPTRTQKQCISANGLNPNDWGVAYYDSEFYMKIVHKTTGKIKLIDKNLRKRR